MPRKVHTLKREKYRRMMPDEYAYRIGRTVAEVERWLSQGMPRVRECAAELFGGRHVG